MHLRHGSKGLLGAFRACVIGVFCEMFTLVLSNHFFLESSAKFTKLQGLLLGLQLLVVLLLLLLVLGCVAMFCVHLLALKTLTTGRTLELISVDEALWRRVRPRRYGLFLDGLGDFFRRFNRLLLFARLQHVLGILYIGLQLLALENMLLPQSFLLVLRLKLLWKRIICRQMLVIHVPVIAF